jgi:hypothetical protein
MKTFKVTDIGLRDSWQTDGVRTPYNGGMSNEVNLSGNLDSFQITAHTPNVCILTGSGNDTISALGISGGPVMIDAGTGANTLTGGVGNTVFQAEGGVGATTDTIRNFMQGDLFQLNGSFVLNWSVKGGSAVLTATEQGSAPVSVVFRGIGDPNQFISVLGHGGAQDNIVLRQA